MKALSLSLLLLHVAITNCCYDPYSNYPYLGTKKILFLIAPNGFQQAEYERSRDILQADGFFIVHASTQKNLATGMDQRTIVPIDITLDTANLFDYDAIVLIGGDGVIDSFGNKITFDFLKKTYYQQKIVGAMCLAGRLLSHCGILKGKRATGWNEDHKLEEIYAEQDVTYENKPVVVDDPFITSSGPEATGAFTRTLIDILNKKFIQE